jgi:hypothetical protein
LPEVVISTDACVTGGAAYYNTDWVYVNWMIDFPSVSDMHINLKELFTVLLALRRWGHQWKNTYLHVYTDNMATKYVLNKGSMRNDIGMDFLREIYCILAMNNINIVAKY